MLNSLDIRNYRNLKELKINSLGRVNLVTGKNNTGKSTLLEAIAIFATKGDSTLIYQLLEERGEIPTQFKPIHITPKVLSALFNNRNIKFDIKDAILIGSLDYVSLRLVKYVIETHKDEVGIKSIKRKILQNDTDKTQDYKIGLEIKSDTGLNFISLENDISYGYGYDPTTINKSVQFIRTRNVTRDINGNLFDSIALTDKEQYVIDALKIIEPLTERIAFVDENSNGRSAVIKLSNSQQILPLQSMGDGINRILTIILAMVNSDNGYLLIDEFENGLHYTVQEKLWKIIFKLSKDLNIQVFATTHSEDCINGFQRILNNSDDLSAGKLIRLDNKNGVIKQVEFDASDLKIATEQDIEIR